MTNRTAGCHFERCLLALSVLVLMGSSVRAAGPEVQSMLPAGVQRGAEATIRLSGKFDTWPPEVWFDRPGLSAEPAEEKGQLVLRAPADAPPGTYWMRLYDSAGATPPWPVVVGMLPEVTESDDEDSKIAESTRQLPCTINGRLAKRGEIDIYRVALSKGETLIASVVANGVLGSPMDGVLQIADPRGFVLKQVDDECGLDPLIVFRAPQDGEYLVRLFAFPETPDSSIAYAGDQTYVYRLTLTTGGFVDHALPLAVRAGSTTESKLCGWNLGDEPRTASLVAAPDCEQVAAFCEASAGVIPVAVVQHTCVTADAAADPAEPQSLELPVTVSGRLAKPAESHTFRFKGEKGQKLRIAVESRSLSFPLDAAIQIVDVDGKVLQEVDDASRAPDPRTEFEVPSDGQYDVTIRDLYGRGGLRFAYRMTIEPVRPDFSLSLAADQFTLTGEKPLEIPVAIDRSGFSGEIEITAIGLPEGVTAEPVTSPGEGDTAKEVKLKLTAATGAAGGPFRVAGRAADASEPIERTARFSVPNKPGTLADAWLTVAATEDAEAAVSDE
ncbi:MAG: PPC domain-containing protein [Pirellulales bacterium]